MKAIEIAVSRAAAAFCATLLTAAVAILFVQASAEAPVDRTVSIAASVAPGSVPARTVGTSLGSISLAPVCWEEVLGNQRATGPAWTAVCRRG